MPSFFQPDPARRIAALEAKVEELANVVRRGKPAANMRDLRDGELFDASNGQVPIYDASVGKWRPGTGGGAASFATFVRSTTLTVTPGGVGNIVGMTSMTYSEGASDYALDGSGRIELLTAGVYMAQGIITYDGSDSTGVMRSAYLEPTAGEMPASFVHQVPPMVGTEGAVAFSHLGRHPAGTFVVPRAIHDASSDLDLLTGASYNFLTITRLR